MAKRGFTLANVRPVLRDWAHERGWALCVGAGLSRPIFPSWWELSRRVIRRNASDNNVEAILSELKSRFSPDAVIQAAHDQLDMGEEEFADVLAEELYRDLKADLRVEDWRIIGRAFDARHIGWLGKATWNSFGSLADEHFEGVSAYRVSKVLAAVLGTSLAPKGILSFNAEPLFFALLNLAVVRDRWTGPPKNPPPDAFDRITHSITTQRPGRLPYYFCHGLLPVPREGTVRGAVNRLVFSETAYLQLANTSFSWQATSFLNYAMSHSILFVGVSLSDANMRRWLTWVHENRISEIQQFDSGASQSANHYWITKDPGSPNKKRWLESSVAHLGVRVVWIPAWKDIGSALKKMLGLDDAVAQNG